MNFQAEIARKKELLKPIQTIVTYPDGQCYVESRSSALPIEIKSKPYGYVVDNKPDNKPGKVLDYLYMGSQDCCMKEVLSKYNISNVVSIGIQAPCICDGVIYHFFECLDLPETNIWEVIKNCVPVIKNSVIKCENTLVHCNAGVSRSASVVIGYLILEFGFDYIKAFEHVCSVRSSIRPNDGFIRQLTENHLYV